MIYDVFRTYTVRVYRNPKKNIGNLFAVDIPCTYTADQNCHGLGKTKIACVRIYRGYPVPDPNRQRKNLAGRPKFDKRYKVQKKHIPWAFVYGCNERWYALGCLAGEVALNCYGYEHVFDILRDIPCIYIYAGFSFLYCGIYRAYNMCFRHCSLDVRVAL